MEENRVSFQILQSKESPYQLGPTMTVIFGLHGIAVIRQFDRLVELPAAGIYVINPLSLYQITCDENAGVICMQIPQGILRAAGWNEKVLLNCHLRDADSADAISMEIRRIFAWLFYTSFQNEGHAQLLRREIELVSLLIEHFEERNGNPDRGSAETMERLQAILRAVHDRWKEPLSLPEIAAQQYVSVGCLSRLFHKYMGVSFNAYLVEVRLRHAEHDLLTTEKTVADIAYDHGFKNANSFITYFKQRWSVTPGQYRRQIDLDRKSPELSAEESSDWMQTLLDYLPTVQIPNQQTAARSIQGIVAVTGNGTAFPRCWSQLLNIGYARDGLIETVQQQIRQAQQEIGFRYLRFHGIFDDDMHIYQVKKDGSPWYNFTYVDLLFDFILSVGLKPFVELSFMPSRLAKKQNTLFDRKCVISTFRYADGWAALIQASLAHWIERYGLEEVRQWRFTTFSINYAGLQEVPFTYEDYLDLYTVTYRALKALDERLCFGGPGGFMDSTLSDAVGRRFLRDVQERDCVPDFFTIQCYPHEDILEDREFIQFTTSQESSPSVISRDEDFTKHAAAAVRKMLAEFGVEGIEVVAEEWRPTLWQRDLSCDTCYTAAWLFKNVFSCGSRIDMLGYWLLTDFLEEWQVPGGVFCGGGGLFTINQIPKAGYQSLLLLSLSGDELLASGEGWTVTRKGHEIQVFFYHYCHYDTFYRYRYQRIRNPNEAYKAFEQKAPLHIALKLTGLPPGDYRQERYTVNRKSGSTYDKWLEIGAPAYLLPSDMRYITMASQPALRINEQSVGRQPYVVEATLQPHEIQVILLKKRDE